LYVHARAAAINRMPVDRTIAKSPLRHCPSPLSDLRMFRAVNRSSLVRSRAAFNRG
jgi:hypothetical protein